MGVLINFLALFYAPPRELGTAFLDSGRRISNPPQNIHRCLIQWPPLRLLLPINMAVCTQVTPRYTNKWGHFAERQRQREGRNMHYSPAPTHPLSVSPSIQFFIFTSKLTISTISASTLPILLVIGCHPLSHFRCCPSSCYPRSYINSRIK